MGKGKERHLWAAPVLYFGLVYLLFFFFFSMSVQTKFQRGFLNWRFVRIWEGDYLFDGFAWIRCFMTVSKHDRHRVSVHLFCGIATSGQRTCPVRNECFVLGGACGLACNDPVCSYMLQLDGTIPCTTPSYPLPDLSLIHI